MAQVRAFMRKLVLEKLLSGEVLEAQIHPFSKRFPACERRYRPRTTGTLKEGSK
jgi:hypothetical protein